MKKKGLSKCKFIIHSLQWHTAHPLKNVTRKCNKAFSCIVMQFSPNKVVVILQLSDVKSPCKLLQKITHKNKTNSGPSMLNLQPFFIYKCLKATAKNLILKTSNKTWIYAVTRFWQKWEFSRVLYVPLHCLLCGKYFPNNA